MSVLIRCAGGSALSVKAGDAVAVCGRLLKLVVLKAVKGGSVALRCGAEELLGAGERPVLLLLAAVI